MAKKLRMGARAAARRAAPAATGTCSGRAPAWMVYAAFVLVALLALALVYQYVARPMLAAARARPFGREGYAAEAPPVKHELVFMHMVGCGWCERFEPVWRSLESKHGEMLAAAGVTLVDHESTAPGAERYKSWVRGYPTVLLMRDGKLVATFEGERTVSGLLAFLRENNVQLSEGFYEAPQRVGSPLIGELRGAGSAISSSKPSDEERDRFEAGAGMKGAGVNK